MVGNRKSEEVVDPKLPEMPASKALKRVLLVALRCVDPDATKRPKIGHVIHMLEADDLLFREVWFFFFFFGCCGFSIIDPIYNSTFLSLLCRKTRLGQILPVHIMIFNQRIMLFQN